MEGPKGFRGLLADWSSAGLVKIVEDEIRFWNGSKIYLCHCKDEKDIYKYQGAEIHLLLIDELTHFTEAMYRFLRNRVRMVGINVSDQWKGRFPRIISGANPGNIGHLWVKKTFVDSRAPYEVATMPKSEGGMKRQMIPARLEDNPSMSEDDPGYEDRLEGLGSEQLVRAMRWGDWNIVEGAFFDCWHDWVQRGGIVRPFAIPDWWVRFRSMDWGSARPFSVGWWAIASEPYIKDGISIPKGAIVRYREWYGCKRDDQGAVIENTGLKMHAKEVGRGVVSKTPEDETIAYTVADPAIFARDGGPSIMERLLKGGLKGIRRADNKRVSQRGAMGGWDMMRERFLGEDERPMMFMFNTCRDAIRTIPAMQHDENRPEDMQTDGEDHCFAAGTMVQTPDGPVSIEKLPPTGFVLAADGHRPYRSARRTKAGADVVRLTFSNSETVVCTPDHLFMTTGGWREARSLVGQCMWMSSLTQSRSSMGAVTTCAAFISSTRATACTGRYGKLTKGQSQTVGTSIISTAIAQTIRSTISIACRAKSTAASTARRMWSGLCSICQPLAPLRLNGMALALAGSGTSANMSSTVPAHYIKQSRSNAIIAARSLRARVASGLGFVLIRAKPLGGEHPASTMLRESVASAAALFRSTNTPSRKRVRRSAASRPRQSDGVYCTSVEPAGQADVYCLTVPGTECFVIEGGLLVHNCADEVRYACMSRPYVRPKPQEARPIDAKPTFGEAVERHLKRRQADREAYL